MPSLGKCYELDDLGRRSQRQPASHLNLMKAKKAPSLIPRLRKLAWHAPASTLNTANTAFTLCAHYTHCTHYTHYARCITHCTHCSQVGGSARNCYAELCRTMQNCYAVSLLGTAMQLMWYELRPRGTTAHFCDPLHCK